MVSVLTIIEFFYVIINVFFIEDFLKKIFLLLI